MDSKVTSILKRIDKLNIWDRACASQFAIELKGCALPYFAIAQYTPDHLLVRAHILFLEGWQSFQSYNIWREDSSFGFITTPMELPGLDVLLLNDGTSTVMRNRPGCQPLINEPEQIKKAEKLLWQVYGLYLRLEEDEKLPYKYVDDGAMLVMRENTARKFDELPLPVMPPLPHKETISFSGEEIKKAKDLPIKKEETWIISFEPNVARVTRDPLQRFAYELKIFRKVDNSRIVSQAVSIRPPEFMLRDLYESFPPRVLKAFLDAAYVPGEIEVHNKRTFRLLRILAMELPFKLHFINPPPGQDHMPATE